MRKLAAPAAAPGGGAPDGDPMTRAAAFIVAMDGQP